MRISCLLSGAVLFVTAMISFAVEAGPPAVRSGGLPPPLEAQLIRQGDFAAALSSALKLDEARDETEAERRLAEAGIAPANGWMADYPVTPAIICELQAATLNAADAGRIPLDADDALAGFYDAQASMGLDVVPYGEEQAGEELPARGPSYPDAAYVEDYYGRVGPPILTYYCPPACYRPMYDWAPYPFLAGGCYFPGFYIQHDFQRRIFFRGRSHFVSNHLRGPGGTSLVHPFARAAGEALPPPVGARLIRGRFFNGVPGSGRLIFHNPLHTPAIPGLAPPRSIPSRLTPKRNRHGSYSRRYGRTNSPPGAARGRPSSIGETRSGAVQVAPSFRRGSSTATIRSDAAGGGKTGAGVRRGHRTHRRR